MRAVVLTGHGDLDRYEYREDWPTPQAGPGEVLIKVHACGLNNTDVNTRTAWYSKGVSDATTGAALARGGRYTCAGAIAGPIVEFDLRTFYLRDLRFTGATVVPPGIFADLAGYIERGEIAPLLAVSYPLRDLVKAQEAFIAKRHVGNIVVTME